MKHLLKSFAFLSIFTLTFQFLGCGGAELQSAKLYRQQRNYIQANKLLEQSLKSDPTGDEAWALYVENLYDLNNYEKLAEVIDTAYTYSLKNRSRVEIIRLNTWVKLYNGGVSAYQQNPDSKEQQKAAIDLLESARKIAPSQPETYELLGDVYFSAQDTSKYLAIYEEALRQVRSTHDQGVALGLMMRMDPSAVETAIGGAPSDKSTTLITASDSALIYHYRSNDGYFYFEKAAKPPRKWQLTGWRFTNSAEVGSQPIRVSTVPYLRLANDYLQKGNKAIDQKDKAKAEEYYSQAVPLLISIQRLDPSDENAATIIPDIYKKLDQPEKAKAAYESMIAEHPSKNLYTAYGAVLMRAEDYNGAIGSFMKALDIDPAYETALFNIGATYKNWAAAEQKKESGKPLAKKGDKTATKTDEIRPKIEKSTEYFEKVVAIDKKEYNSLANLVENYDLLGKPDKSKETIQSLESLKNTEIGKDAGYWNLLGSIYARVNRVEDSAAAFKKADQLKK